MTDFLRRIGSALNPYILPPDAAESAGRTLGMPDGSASSEEPSPYERPTGWRDFNEQIRLNPEERKLYFRHRANLKGEGGIDNPDGSRSTLSAEIVGFDDRAYIIPTIWHGYRLSTEQSVNEAKSYGLQHFPSYDSVEAAEKRYGEMHELMERDVRVMQYERDGLPQLRKKK